MKSSILGRAADLAKLAARVGFKEMKSGSVQSRIEQAMLIAQSLSKLKGAAMKVGQLLSFDLNHYFPPEAIELLSQLQNAAVAHPFESIQNTLRQELGDEMYAKVENLSQTPLGIASIGQVHRAQFMGDDIVLKIQYPGVSDSIDSDLKILKTLANSFCVVSGRKINLDPLFAEFKSVLKQEVDYKSEAEFQKRYGVLAEGLNRADCCRFRIPRVVDELSTNRILAMTYENGVNLKTWISRSPSKLHREIIGRSLLDLYFTEFFEWRLVQTDPNWANFLIDDSLEIPSLVLLDFGATRKYSKSFVENYIQLLILASSRESTALKSHAIEIGMIDRRESDAAFAAFEEMLSIAIEPFFATSSNGCFNFADPIFLDKSQIAAKELTRHLVHSSPPPGLVFLHRKLAGVYSILKSLKVELDVSDYWQKMLAGSRLPSSKKTKVAAENTK